MGNDVADTVSPEVNPRVAGAAARLEAAQRALGAVRREVEARVLGQPRVVEETLAALLAGGHGLLIGPPGLAKTRLVQTLGTVLGLRTQRVQFTPDLMPTDILGSEVLDTSADGRRSFRFIEGPVFTELLMADEINRASPRTQSALLQAMAEGEVAVAGQPRALPKPFHVLATQNPIEQDGTYPLPEAQLDRFLLKIDVGYPDAETERQILLATTAGTEATPEARLDAGALMDLQAFVRDMAVGERVMAVVVHLLRSLRPEQTTDAEVRAQVLWGPSPRAGQALLLAGRARALLRGRSMISLDDVEALAWPALSHRIGVRYQAAGTEAFLKGLVARMTAEAVRTPAP
jgi:MoxR-like ATPase